MSGFIHPWDTNTVPGNAAPAVSNPADTPIDFPGANAWSVPFSDFAPPDNRFALELRAESIEQLSGGDALRRGENERIEAGGSDGNTDLVAGCDRVQVQGTLDEHTGHGLAVQAAHFDTTIDGSSDTWAGQEDTMLLAGHMRDTWNRGSATVAAMCDDLAAGGGVRINALDLWVHGLMGLEERPGTCTADGVLAEACGTLYEREYRTAVHAAGFAMFNGTLYQSVRNSFRPLMRISMGVRNLIAGGGGGAGGEAPPAAPPPAGGAAGAQGAEAATETLAAGRGIGESTGRAVGDAIHPGLAELDALAAELRAFASPAAGRADETGGAAHAEDLHQILRSTDTAEQLGALQRGTLDGWSHAADLRPEVRQSFADGNRILHSRTSSDLAGNVPVPAVGTDDTILVGDRLGALLPQPGVENSQADLGRLHPREPLHLENPGTGGWSDRYRELNRAYDSYQSAGDWHATFELYGSIADIDSLVMKTYRDFSGSTDGLANRFSDPAEVEQAYHALERMALQAEQANDTQRAVAIRTAVMDIDWQAHEIVARLAERADEFASGNGKTAQYVRLDPSIDPDRLGAWVEEQIDGATLARRVLDPQSDSEAMRRLSDEINYFVVARHELHNGRNPTFNSNSKMMWLSESGHIAQSGQTLALHARLVGAMDDPTNHRPIAAFLSDASRTPAHVGLPDPGLSPLPHGPGTIVNAPAGATGDTTSHVHEAAAIASPEIDGGSAIWRTSTDTPYAAGRAEFDPGLEADGARAQYTESAAGTRLPNDIDEPLSEPGSGVLDSGNFGSEPDGVYRVASLSGSTTQDPGLRHAPNPGWRRPSPEPSMLEPLQPPDPPTARTPRFGRLTAPESSSLPRSPREWMLRRIRRGEPLLNSQMQLLQGHFARRVIAGEIKVGSAQWGAMSELIGDLGRARAVAQRSGSAARVYDGIDWGELEALLQLLHPPRDTH